MRVGGWNYLLVRRRDCPDKNKRHTIEVVIDRLKVLDDRKGRISEAVEAALSLSGGYVLLVTEGGKEQLLTENYACPDCGISLPEIEPRLFSFNNPYGACPDCSGLGSHEHFSEEHAIDPVRSVEEGALLPWKKKHYMLRKLYTFSQSKEWDYSAIGTLPKNVQNFILYGSDERLPMFFSDRGERHQYMGRYEGLLPWLEGRWNETESENVLEELAGYRVEDIFQTCHGYRLRPEALMVQLNHHTIDQLVEMPVDRLLPVLKEMEFTENEQKIMGQVMIELEKRLSFLVDVALVSVPYASRRYLSAVRVRYSFATQIGSSSAGFFTFLMNRPLAFIPEIRSSFVYPFAPFEILATL